MTHSIPRIATDRNRPEPAETIPTTFRCGGCDGQFPAGDTCHCAVCHLTFMSVTPFDKHRRAGACLTEADLRDRGMEPNAKGLWRHPRPEASIPTPPH